jgi:hypothetical protein
MDTILFMNALTDRIGDNGRALLIVPTARHTRDFLPGFPFPAVRDGAVVVT